MNIFVMAAGEGIRWGSRSGVPKQWLTFGNETLLERIYRQCIGSEFNLYLVTQDEKLYSNGYKAIYVGPTRSLAESIERTKRYWTERNIFLLGDVFYSRDALSTVISDISDLAFFGRPWPSAYVRCGHGEMFAISIRRHGGLILHSAIQSLVNEKGGRSVGNIWNIYQSVAGLRMGSSRIRVRWFRLVDDYTNDIDTWEDWCFRSHIYEAIARGEECSGDVRNLKAQTLRHLLGVVRWFVKSYIGREYLFASGSKR